MHRDTGEWRHGGRISPSALSKGAMEVEVPFHHRRRSRQIFGSAKDFCPNFPKLAQKVFCAIFT